MEVKARNSHMSHICMRSADQYTSIDRTYPQHSLSAIYHFQCRWKCENQTRLKGLMSEMVYSLDANSSAKNGCNLLFRHETPLHGILGHLFSSCGGCLLKVSIRTTRRSGSYVWSMTQVTDELLFLIWFCAEVKLQSLERRVMLLNSWAQKSETRVGLLMMAAIDQIRRRKAHAIEVHVKMKFFSKSNACMAMILRIFECINCRHRPFFTIINSLRDGSMKGGKRLLWKGFVPQQ